MFVAGGIVIGMAMVVNWTIAYSELEDQATPEQGGLNMALINDGFHKNKKQ